MELLDGSTFYLTCKNGGHLPLVITTDTTISGIHFQDSTLFSSGSPCETFLSVTYQNNQNLRLSQKEVLLLHKNLGCSRFQWFHNICRIPKDPSWEQTTKPTTTQVTKCNSPLCAACQMYKQNQCTRDWRATGHPDPIVIHGGNLRPLNRISIYQYISSVPGRLPHTKEKDPRNNKYSRGTIFVDHGSSYSNIKKPSLPNVRQDNSV